MSILIRKRIALTIFLGSIISLTLSGIWIFLLYQDVFKANTEVATNAQTIRAANQALLSINEAEANITSFLLTNNTEFIKKLPGTIVTTQVSLATVSQLIQDDKEEIEIYKNLQARMNAKIELIKKVISAYTAGNTKLAIQLISDPARPSSTTEINQLLIKIKRIELGQLQETSSIFHLKSYLANQAFVKFGIINVLLILLAYVLARPLMENNRMRYEANV